MKKVLSILTLCVLIMNCSAKADAASITNVALNKEVTLNGNFFTGGSTHTGTIPSPAPKESIVDGIYLPKNTQWDQNTVFWNKNMAMGQEQSIEINLLGSFNIYSLSIQADDNDAYQIYYRDLTSNNWEFLTEASNVKPLGTWGMQTRPDINDPSALFPLSSPVHTDSFKIIAGQSDCLCSVSEFQAYGTPAPEPTTMLIGLMGLAGASRLRRKK